MSLAEREGGQVNGLRSTTTSFQKKNIMLQPKTIKQLLKKASKKINILDAQLLLAHVLKKSREFLVAHPEQTIGKIHIIKYKYLVKKRMAGVPVAYLTGHKEFYGLDFLVNKHALTPRPDTEIMVDAVLEKLQSTDNEQQTTLIDVGTGSSCIPIAILKNLSTCKLEHLQTFATDISKSALKVAKKNAKKNNVNITFKYGNLLEPIFKNSSLFTDYCSLTITANLPYLTEQQFENESSIQHEPKSALVADKQGLALYEELLKQIKLLVTSYKLQVTTLLEIDPSQSTPIKTLIKKYLPAATIEIKKDLAGHDRIVKVKLSPKTKKATNLCLG